MNKIQKLTKAIANNTRLALKGFLVLMLMVFSTGLFITPQAVYDQVSKEQPTMTQVAVDDTMAPVASSLEELIKYSETMKGFDNKLARNPQNDKLEAAFMGRTLGYIAGVWIFATIFMGLLTQTTGGKGVYNILASINLVFGTSMILGGDWWGTVVPFYVIGFATWSLVIANFINEIYTETGDVEDLKDEVKKAQRVLAQLDTLK